MKARRAETPIPEPAGLSEKALEIWRDVVPRHCKAVARLALLETALRARDRGEQASEAIAKEGMLSAGEGKMPHLNPLVRIEKDSAALFARLWRQLGLDWRDNEPDE